VALPKKKTTSAKRDKRRANWKLSSPNMTECSQCGEMKLSHRICKNCGYYNRKAVISKDI
jgi:large subunit ribosomal protein L32